MTATPKTSKKLQDAEATAGFNSPSLSNSMDRQEVADYIASMSADLQGIAQTAELPFLSYLISLVVEEARQVEGGNLENE